MQPGMGENLTVSVGGLPDLAKLYTRWPRASSNHHLLPLPAWSGETLAYLH